MFSALIIDADEAANASIRGALAPYGFEFTATQDASEAMTLARTATPDIVFLRVELPNVSGFSVCNKLRRNDETKYIPLVMYASDVSTDVFEQHRNLKTHADDYLKLPFEDEALVASVGGLMELPPPGTDPEPDPADSLEVNIDDVVEPTDDAGLEMTEFESGFAEMEEPAADKSSGGDDIADEMEAAFDGLLEESASAPEPEPEPEPVVEAEPEPEPVVEAEPEPDSGATSSGSDFKAQREVIQLKGQLNAKKREILAFKGELESHERAVLDVKHKNRELLTLLGEMEEKALGAEEQIITAREQADVANRDKNTILKREEGLKLRLEGTQKKAKDLEEQLGELQQQTTDAQETSQKKIAALHRELESAESDLASTRDSRDETQTALDSAQVQFAELSDTLQSQTDKGTELAERVVDLEAQLSSAAEAHELAKQEAATQLNEAAESAAAAMEAATADKETAVATQKREHQAEREFEESQHRTELERLRGEIDGVREELSTARQDAEAQATSLRGELAGVQDQLKAAQTELDARRNNEHRAQQALAVALRVLDGQPTS